MVFEPGRMSDDGARHFEALSPALWNPLGNMVVAAAQLHVSERVLDACCGTGSSAVPAAQSVGPDGYVEAVDVSEAMLALAATKRAALSLDNLGLHCADATTWTPAEAHDAILCCYGMFSFADMDSAARHLVDQLRPGGRLALSAWAAGAHQTFVATLLEVCTRYRPELADVTLWSAANRERIDSAEKLDAWLSGLGLENIQIAPTEFSVYLDADLAWSLVEGSSYRALLPHGAQEQEDVRIRFLDSLGPDFHLNADTLVAVADRPA